MSLTTFIITAAVIAVYVYLNFFHKRDAKFGFKSSGSHAIRKEYKFIKVEFRSLVDGDGVITDGLHGFINTQNPLIVSNLSHLFDEVQNESGVESTILKKFNMRFDSPGFEKWLQSFDESIIVLEGTKL